MKPSEIQDQKTPPANATIQAIKSHFSCREMFRRFWPNHYRETGNCLCPFHEDSSPSYQLDENLGFCHREPSCGGFDVIDLYARGMGGISNSEAIAELAREIGLDHSSRQALPLSLEEVFKRRGIRDDTFKSILPRLELLKGNGKYPPSFSIPVATWEGSPVGKQFFPLAGGEKKFSKGTPAKKAFIRFEGPGLIVITEGFWDALSVKDAVPKADSVAILGAGFTAKLSSLPEDREIILFLDRDEAGQKATDKAVKVLNGRCRVVDWSLCNHKFKDPNDILKSIDGEHIIEAMIRNAKQPNKANAKTDPVNCDSKTDPVNRKEAQSPQVEGIKKKPSHADLLTEIAVGECELFHDPSLEGYASFAVAGHRETWPLRSRGFKRWVFRRFYEEHGRSPRDQALKDALGALEGKAIYDGPEEEVCIRVGGAPGKIFVDLCTDDWKTVEITGVGWKVSDGAGRCKKFIRSPGMQPLPVPVPGASWNGLDSFLNLPENGLKLVAGWLVQSFSPTGPYPILVLEGEQGSSKSTISKILRSLIDPSTVPIRSEPKEERDLVIGANNAWVLSFDNLSGLAPWLSDALCRISTGGGFACRTLYSDRDETLFTATRPIILNGIDAIATRHDLADRSLLLNLPPIPDEKRKNEKEFWGEWERVRPGIFGLLLDAVGTALRNRESVKIERSPRMADFAHWIVAAEPSLPWGEGEFLNAYAKNIQSAVDLSLEASPVGSSLREFMEDKHEWTGTATTLLERLKEKMPDEVVKLPHWPKDGTRLSKQLRRLASFLRKDGIDINFDFREGGTGKRNIRIEKSFSRDFSVISVTASRNSTQTRRDKGSGDVTLKTICDAKPKFCDAKIPAQHFSTDEEEAL